MPEIAFCFIIFFDFINSIGDYIPFEGSKDEFINYWLPTISVIMMPLSDREVGWYVV